MVKATKVAVVKATESEVVRISEAMVVIKEVDKIKVSLEQTWSNTINMMAFTHHFILPLLRVFSNDRLQSGPCKRSTVINFTC